MSRAALVTGAGQNIGRAIAVELARDGFDVAVNGLTNRVAAEETADLVLAEGQKTLVAMGDTGKAGDCKEMVAAAQKAFGRLDVVVHNAAIRPSKPFLETSDEDWDRVLDVNLSGAVWLSKAALPGMVEAGWGRIVLFAGMNAIHGYNGRAATSVSKHGCWGLAKSLGKEFGPKGVSTNIISPGPIASEHADASMTAHINAQVGRIPLGRLGRGDEIAAMVSHLCSDRGGFVNGQMIQINGGTET